ncbi:MAG: hemerythrin domain-containing protein [Pyrinomonadaceae bacterium]
MDAIKLLKQDHEDLRNLFSKVRETESMEKKVKYYNDIEDLLAVHTQIEEKIFYPAVRAKEKLEDIVKEGIQEHHVTDLLIAEINDLVDDSSVFEPKLKVLMEGVEHHIEEEEKEMFPDVRSEFSETEISELGAEMEKARKGFAKSNPARA